MTEIDLKEIPDLKLGVSYKTHPIFTRYIVSSDGDVYSTSKALLKNGERRIRSPYLRLHKMPDRDGYFKISMRHSGRFFRPSIHRMVLETFIGPCREGMEGCHNDGNKSNNSLNNLRWDTPRKNADDKIRHWVHKGTRNSSAKLTDEQVRQIRSHRFYRGYKNDLATMFGVSSVLIKKIRSGNLWTHLL